MLFQNTNSFWARFGDGDLNKYQPFLSTKTYYSIIQILIHNQTLYNRFDRGTEFVFDLEFWFIYLFFDFFLY